MKWFVLTTKFESGAMGDRYLLALACTLAFIFGWSLAVYGAIYASTMIRPHWAGIIACLVVIIGMSYAYVRIIIPNDMKHSSRKKEG